MSPVGGSTKGLSVSRSNSSLSLYSSASAPTSPMTRKVSCSLSVFPMYLKKVFFNGIGMCCLCRQEACLCDLSFFTMLITTDLNTIRTQSLVVSDSPKGTGKIFDYGFLLNPSLQALLRRSFSGDRCIRPRSSIAALGSDLQFTTTGEDLTPSPCGQSPSQVTDPMHDKHIIVYHAHSPPRPFKLICMFPNTIKLLMTFSKVFLLHSLSSF